MNNLYQQLRDKLTNAGALLSQKKVAAGFDGFVDAIVKVVNHKTETGDTVYFDTIAQFGNYISGKSGSGFSLESEELVQKLGGNMPIMANAIAQMEAPVSCIGAFGVPTIAPAFAGMHQGCKLHTYTNPGFTTAMEFADGKIMLAQMTDLNQANWQTIKIAVGLPKLKEVFLTADLVCLVNWSELDHSNNIWEGLLNDVFISSADTRRTFFFDLSDCSKRKPEVISKAISIIKQFSNYGSVTLSLNRNEANILHQIFLLQAAPANLKETGRKLFGCLDVDELMVHSSKISALWNAGGAYENAPVFIANPKFSTGAGDNFNAGYCTAKLLGLPPAESLLMANSVANLYITNGQSPDVQLLMNYLSDNNATGLQP